MNSTEIKTFELSDEMRKKLDNIKNASSSSGRVFTEEEEFVILEYYEKKNKEQLAEMLGINASTLRKYYLKLKAKNGTKE